MIFNQTRRRVRHYFFLLHFILTVQAIGGNTEYWIIENPAALIIYNQYEQRLNPGEKSTFSAYSAWQILTASQLLSDQFTPAVKTRIDRQLYYFQLSGEGQLLNREQAGKIEIIKNASTLNDTIRLKNSKRFFMDSGQGSRQLSEGQLLIRLFQYDRRIYVRELDGQMSGWLLGGASTDYEIYQVDTKTAAYEKRLFQQADRIFQTYNRRFEKLFSYLNRRDAQSLPAPQWLGSASSAKLSYRLQPTFYHDRFPATSAFLAQELKDLLHGSDYALVVEESEILIKKMPR
jgi:hypothetical protein